MSQENVELVLRVESQMRAGASDSRRLCWRVATPTATSMSQPIGPIQGVYRGHDGAATGFSGGRCTTLGSVPPERRRYVR